MGKKNFKNDIVYSTESNVVEEINSEEEIEALDVSKQRLKMQIEKKGRKGKSVTVISNYIGPKADMEQLARSLKSYCGVGGTVKNNTIEIQGDMRNKIREKLISLGYRI